MRPFTCIISVALLTSVASGQPAQAPAFEIADVHVSARSANPRMTGGLLLAGRYELQKANMVDLIRTAYSVDADNVIGGPSWLESDRFDVVAKTPPSTSPEKATLMLRALLADRFKLVVHNDTRPMPAFVLTVGKGKPKLKEADGSGSPGCQVQRPTPEIDRSRLFFCRSETMEAFAQWLREMAGGYVTSPVVNSTELKGAWDFDFKWTARVALQAAGEYGITVFDALDKQLGLKLELQKVPTSVIVVDSVNQKPTANPPGVTTSLPPSRPAEFEVADIKPSLPGVTMGGAGFQSGGRVEFRGIPMMALITLAWEVDRDEIMGLPKWIDSAKFDLIAKASTTGKGSAIEFSDMQSMLRVLLTDRFKIATHYEDRPMNAYTLMATKPKLKKADPTNRTGCKTEPAPLVRAPSVPGPPLMLATCQNMTMAQFAEQLQSIAPVYIHHPALDSTGMEGAWDFSLTFSRSPAGAGGRGGGRNGGGGVAPPSTGEASEPSDSLTLFEALNKLGLKLEMQKRPMPVLVIDHIEQKPTEN